MSFKAVIKDYQSLESAVLEVDQLTVVTGRSNLGKSALIRAIAAAWFGQYGESFVRRGQSMTAVGVRFDDGQAIKWYKVPASKKVPGKESVLEINGQKHTKVGKEHDQLTAPLGLRALEAGGGYYHPQVARQFDPVFLVGENESTAAEIFRVLGKGDVVAYARTAAKKDHGALLAEKKGKDQDLQGLDQDLKTREWSSQLLRTTDELVLKAGLLEGYQQSSEETLQEISQLESLPSLEVPSIPSIVGLGEKSQLLLDVKVALTLILPDVPVMPETPKLETGVWLKVTEALAVNVQLEGALAVLDLAKVEERALQEGLEHLKKELGTCPLCDEPFRTHAHA